MMLSRHELKQLLRSFSLSAAEEPFFEVASWMPQEPLYLVFCLPAQISEVAKVSV